MCRKIRINAIDELSLSTPDLRDRVVELPASKSVTNRALMLNALSGGHTHLRNIALCDDSNSMQAALNSADSLKDIGAAGTAMRFLTAYYALQEGLETRLTGSERMKNRPIALLVNALRSLGAEIDYLEKEGYPPLQIQGRRLQGGEIHIDGSVSSQYLSALLMIGPLCQNGLVLHIEGKINSRPYITMTLALMKTFGVEAIWKDACIRVPAQSYTAPAEYLVEYDWSAASYWFEMVALSDHAKVLLKGMQSHSIQGDARVLEWFRHLGVKADFLPEGLLLRSEEELLLPAGSSLTESEQTIESGGKASGNNALPPFVADFSQQPDLAQTFVVTCALQGRPFSLSGLESLRIKETDRIAALVKEMRKLGFVLKVEGDTLDWCGERSEPQEPVSIETYEDHRMAMAFAPAVLKWQGRQPLAIRNPKVVSKSYPEFCGQFFESSFPPAGTSPSSDEDISLGKEIRKLSGEDIPSEKETLKSFVENV